jgi:ComF family protein
MSGARCGECLRAPPAFDATVVAADYSPPVDRLVLALKFGSQLALAPLFARLLHEAWPGEGKLPMPDRLTAVPLGRQRLAERGFNQALEIARPLSRALGIVLDPHAIARLRETRAQTLLHPDERHENIRHAFVVPAGAMARVHGRHIGIVDDVITTGETLNEVAATLKRFGAVRVTNFVFARTFQK